jgi:urate oxidase
VVAVDGDDVHVLAGLTDLVVLKSTGSEFWGFPRDRYTTLPETADRILATAVTARWRYVSTDLDFNTGYDSVRTTLLETFAGTHSLALQQSLYAMGEAVLEQHAAVAEVRFSMPNKHHFLADLSAFGLDNSLDGPGAVVYHAADRPYGLIEGTVLRDDVPAAPAAWLGTPGFC